MTTNYDWIKPGVKVRIKTVQQIKETYGECMPCGLTSEMQDLCGTIQVVQYVSIRNNDRYKLCVQIDGWNWPEGAILPALTRKGNSL